MLIARVNFIRGLRFQSTERNFIEQINRIKSKDLTKIFNEQQIKKFFQLKRTAGGKFYSIEQLNKEPDLSINFEQFLSSMKNANDPPKTRILIEPRLTSTTVADIESVCSLDYTSSYINWTIVQSTKEKNQFHVQQWNSRPIDLERKYHFIKIFHQITEQLSTLPLNDASVLLVDQPTYRYPNLKLAPYISQLQQIRAIFNTLLHCQLYSQRPIYHISGRDVASHFGLFVGNEQSSAEFYLTNLMFHTSGTEQTFLLDIDDQLKTNFHQLMKGQREPMAQCLLRAIAFLQCVNEKKVFFSNEQ